MVPVKVTTCSTYYYCLKLLGFLEKLAGKGIVQPVWRFVLPLVLFVTSKGMLLETARSKQCKDVENFRPEKSSYCSQYSFFRKGYWIRLFLTNIILYNDSSLDWCQDLNTKCKAWKSRGLCTSLSRRAQRMMRKLCPETCNFCGKLHVCKPLTFRESSVLGFPLHF